MIMRVENNFFLHPNWPVLFEDNHLLGLYKPAGLAVQGDITGEDSLLDLAKEWLKERYRKPGKVFLGLVHRLDQPVAGAMVFCRTSKAARRLSEQFRKGEVIKRYLAVVEGFLSDSSGRLVDYLKRVPNRSSRVLSGADPRGREARLEFRVLDRRMDSSLVEIRLETGRHHQIRVQMSNIGHPVLGDMRYGASAPLGYGQIALLATEIVLKHPTSHTEICIRSPIPRGWPWREKGESLAGLPWHWREYLLEVADLGKSKRSKAAPGLKPQYPN